MVEHQLVHIVHILQEQKFGHFMNVRLYFVMATALYLLYITTTLYLNTTYTDLSTKNCLKNI